ncbi:hypothetical protein OFM04_30310, partial [Escherichia coli]|nr:hypothetical protein [Escherichia coli]
MLVQDAVIGGGINDSDVQLYHLSADRLGLVVRIQRDLYNVPTAKGIFATPATLDQATSAALALTLWGDFDGAQTLKSWPYPAEVGARALVRPAL